MDDWAGLLSQKGKGEKSERDSVGEKGVRVGPKKGKGGGFLPSLIMIAQKEQ